MQKLVVGVPKEIKDNENRVSVQPDGVAELVHAGHEVLVETGRRRRVPGSPTPSSPRPGRSWWPARTRCSPGADLIVKVKEPIAAEYHRFREGQQLFTYLHLAADKPLTEFLMEQQIDSIAYETVQTADGKLPLLTPMSEVAGRMAVQAAAHHLESPAGGAGLLLGGVPGTPAAKVLIIGGGVSGTEAAKIALGMRAIVRVLDTNPSRLAYLSDIFGGRLDLVVPNRARTAAYVAESDVVIGAVLVPGAKAPKLVSREMIASMRPGSVVVDIAIDQGGCFETSRPTTHSDPTYVEDGRRALLRGEHPRRGGPHLDAGPDLGDAALPAAGGRARRPRGGRGRPGAGQGPEHARRQAGEPAGGRGARACPTPTRPRCSPADPAPGRRRDGHHGCPAHDPTALAASSAAGPHRGTGRRPPA